jgi:fatty acid desaturase
MLSEETLVLNVASKDCRKLLAVVSVVLYCCVWDRVTEASYEGAETDAAVECAAHGTMCKRSASTQLNLLNVAINIHTSNGRHHLSCSVVCVPNVRCFVSSAVSVRLRATCS